jgi:hypothetical protein
LDLRKEAGVIAEGVGHAFDDLDLADADLQSQQASILDEPSGQPTGACSPDSDTKAMRAGSSRPCTQKLGQALHARTLALRAIEALSRGIKLVLISATVMLQARWLVPFFPMSPWIRRTV